MSEQKSQTLDCASQDLTLPIATSVEDNGVKEVTTTTQDHEAKTSLKITVLQAHDSPKPERCSFEVDPLYCKQVGNWKLNMNDEDTLRALLPSQKQLSVFKYIKNFAYHTGKLVSPEREPQSWEVEAVSRGLNKTMQYTYFAGHDKTLEDIFPKRYPQPSFADLAQRYVLDKSADTSNLYTHYMRNVVATQLDQRVYQILAPGQIVALEPNEDLNPMVKLPYSLTGNGSSRSKYKQSNSLSDSIAASLPDELYLPYQPFKVSVDNNQSLQVSANSQEPNNLEQLKLQSQSPKLEAQKKQDVMSIDPQGTNLTAPHAAIVSNSAASIRAEPNLSSYVPSAGECQSLSSSKLDSRALAYTQANVTPQQINIAPTSAHLAYDQANTPSGYVPLSYKVDPQLAYTLELPAHNTRTPQGTQTENRVSSQVWADTVKNTSMSTVDTRGGALYKATQGSVALKQDTVSELACVTSFLQWATEQNVASGYSKALQALHSRGANTAERSSEGGYKLDLESLSFLAQHAPQVKHVKLPWLVDIGLLGEDPFEQV